jgi:8-oxo-dGTP pyrophosphatase MutT (NUDIX family)
MDNSEQPREGIVVVVVRDGRLLMVRRALGVPAGGSWCFVGGAIEPGESQPDAVVREFHEEVAGRVRPIRKVWEYTRPDGKLRLHWWLAELDADELRPDPAEVSEVRWCTPADMEGLPQVLASNLAFLREVGCRLIDRRRPRRD